jgi:hypothetical protein
MMRDHAGTLLAALLVMISIAHLAGPSSVAHASDITTPRLPYIVTDGALWPISHPLLHPTYQSFNKSPFGSPCQICPTQAIQGALNDCALLSALAAVATVSPGTIEHAIRDTGQRDVNGDEVYGISYWDQTSGGWTVRYVTSSFPGQTLATGDMWWSNISQNRRLLHPFTPFFIYAQLPPNNAIWPMLMEKAYVAMPWMSRGYGTGSLLEYANLQEKVLQGPNVDLSNLGPALQAYASLPDSQKVLGEGLNPGDTLTQVTGYATTSHEVRAAQAPKQVASVWIRDSPAMADTRGHSIIAGLLRGDLKAVEPNLKTCVTPLGQPHADPVCTAPCRESHTCRRAFVRSVPSDSGQKFHVRILDVDLRSGSEHELYSFDKALSGCTVDSPCRFDVPANQWVSPGPLEISFGVTDADPLEALDRLLTRLQRGQAAAIVGSRAQSQCPADDSVCTQAFGPPLSLVNTHAYYLKRYVRNNGASIANNELTIGDPHGGELAERTLTLNQFYHAFLMIYENPTGHESSSCTCSH